MDLFSLDNHEARQLRLRVRFFLVAVTVFFFGILIFTAARQGAFTQSIPLYFFASSAQDISIGVAVKVLGFKVGKVDNITIEPDHRIKVKLMINDEYVQRIPRGSIVRMTKEGLIGASVLDIQPGTDKSRTVAPNDVVAFERDVGLTGIAERLSGQLHPILADVKEITAALANPQGDLRSAIREIEASAAAIRQSSDALRVALQQSGGHISEASQKMSVVLDQTADNMVLIKKNLDVVDKSLPGMLTKLDATLESSRKVAEEAERQASPLLDGARGVADDAHELTDGIKRIWPFNRMIPVPQTEVLPSDSHVPNR
jgi:phospholipid/cholesterol/gamma-HCH transport system substrate-binding protein